MPFPKRASPAAASVLLALSLGAGACRGFIITAPALRGDGGADAGPLGERLVRAACEPGAPPGPAPLRRLTHAEYNNTVRDLLGTASRPADAFAPQSREGALDTDVSNQSVQPTLVAQYIAAAGSLAAEATASPEA